MKTVELTVKNGVYVITPRKNLAGGEETTELVSAVSGIAASEPVPRVVLDLGKISWASSLGIESLMRAKRYCTERNGWLRIAGVDKRIHDTMLVMRIEVLFDVVDTVEAAVSELELKSRA